MRARVAIAASAQRFEIREILLKEKPAEMLRASPKGTVPVAIFPDQRVIEESLELMLWSLGKNDPENWLANINLSLSLIWRNDHEFKYWLDRYKYHVGYPEHSQDYYRKKACEFLRQLEESLRASSFLIDGSPSLADAAIFPFVRQFAFVDKSWFDNSEFDQLKRWLDHWLESKNFQSVMQKYAVWGTTEEKVFFFDAPLK